MNSWYLLILLGGESGVGASVDNLLLPDGFNFLLPDGVSVLQLP